MTTQTPNYQWDMPDPGGSPNTWGSTLNGTTGKIDAQMKKNEVAGVPIGAITMWGGVTPPGNWLTCDGSLLSQTTYPDLFAVLGTRFNPSAPAGQFQLPSFRDLFPIGASSTHALAATGGALTATLTAAMLPAHAHPITQVAHSHTATQPAHTHPDPGHGHPGSTAAETGQHTHGPALLKWLGSGGNLGITGGSNVTTISNTDPSNAPGEVVNIAANVTGLQAAGNDAITVTPTTPTGPTATGNNAGTSAPVPFTPPWLGINFIVKAK